MNCAKSPVSCEACKVSDVCPVYHYNQLAFLALGVIRDFANDPKLADRVETVLADLDTIEA